uniref:Uncharacterized protein n=1 Tax=Strongyloides venezuelensis TaxID=75913 RepID=A0A0K0FRM7_STRVS
MRRYQFTQNLYYKISNKEIIYAISVGISQCSYGEIENCGLLLLKFFRTFNDIFDKIKKIDEHNSKKGTNSMKTTTSNENSADKDSLNTSFEPVSINCWDSLFQERYNKCQISYRDIGVDFVYLARTFHQNLTTFFAHFSDAFIN